MIRSLKYGFVLAGRQSEKDVCINPYAHRFLNSVFCNVFR